MMRLFNDGIYLADDRKAMGSLFEYCDKYAERNYHVKISKRKFINKFMSSRMRYLMDCCHPRLLSQAAEDTFTGFVEFYLDNDPTKLCDDNDTNVFWEYQLKWCGEMYAYAHCMTWLPSKRIFEAMPLEEMCHYYITGHQMDFAGAYDKISGAFVAISKDERIILPWFKDVD